MHKKTATLTRNSGEMRHQSTHKTNYVHASNVAGYVGKLDYMERANSINQDSNCWEFAFSPLNMSLSATSLYKVIVY